jgi:uncharacterized protein with von Willebrand factor type A (vWA) domain
VGPFHTNTVAGLQLAMDLLSKKRNTNKQIFMITDGKPSCVRERWSYYMNSNGLDEYIVDKCYSQANSKITHSHHNVHDCDPYLQQFVNKFTEANQGSLHRTERTWRDDFEDYETNRKKKIK